MTENILPPFKYDFNMGRKFFTKTSQKLFSFLKNFEKYFQDLKNYNFTNPEENMLVPPVNLHSSFQESVDDLL